MAIYRGPGGSGDAVNDSSSEVTLAVLAREAAQAAQVAAESAQAAAETAETNAETAETNAETAETNAETAATAAQLAETNAETAQAAAEAAQAAAEAAQTAAETAETNAETAETNAETAATAAEAAQAAAELAQTGAETAETNAETAQAAAEAARDAALSAYDNFDDRYLGPKSSDPTLDNDGNALVAGALYFNTTSSVMKVYTGSAWVSAYVSAAGVLLVSNNLSDVASVATSRTNLGVTATGADTTYAYRANNLSDLASASTARTNLGLGTAATTAATDYATAAQGAKADTALQSYTETDPVFIASEAYSITSTDTSNWDTAYGWGNHASAGYLTSAVTSVAASVPTGLSISGSPITSTGTLAISYSAGYAIPTTAKQTEWDTAYGWGNHASAGYLLSSSYTASDVLSKLLTVDGAGSGLDADTLDGNSSAYFYAASNPSGYTTNTGTVTSVAVSGTNITVSGSPVTSSGTISVSIPQAVGTSSSVQFGSFGVGTAASGTTGEIRATHNVTAYYSSDRTLKENIKDVDSALDKVCAIGSKTFDWTDEYIAAHGGEDGYFVQKSDFGVIAQDVQSVFPQAVRTREDGTLAVDYEKLSTLAFGAIKELVKRIEVLEAK
jgi:hypothetical protein